MKKVEKLLPPSKSHLSFPVTFKKEKASKDRQGHLTGSEALIPGLFQ